MNPTQLKSPIAKAIELRNKGKLDRSKDILKQLVTEEPSNTDAWLTLGNIYQQENDLINGISCYEKIIKLQPDNFTTLNNLGVLYVKQGNTNQAISCWQKVINIKPDYPEVYHNVGILNSQLQNLSKAEEYFLYAIKLNPNYSEAYYNLGLIYESIGDSCRAFDYYQKTVQLQPNHLKADIQSQHTKYFQKALTCYLRGNLQKAELICRYLLKEEYKVDEVYTLLGLICLNIEAYDFAILYFTKALEINPDRNIAKSNLNLAQKARENNHSPNSITKKEKFLLIKAWGYGFWSDVNCVIGQLLIAELTNRIPIIEWGDNSLYRDPEDGNGFELYFQPVSKIKIDDLLNESYTFYPPQWTEDNLHSNEFNKHRSSDYCRSGLYLLFRNEDIVVSDYHTFLVNLIPWIPPHHYLYNYTPQNLYRYLVNKYLKLNTEISKDIEEYWHNNLAGHKTIAVHIRGSDKIVEQKHLPKTNKKYDSAIEFYLKQAPDALIFLLTDDSIILEKYKKIYGDRLRYTNCVRTNSQTGIHHQQQQSRKTIGYEIVKDTYLAAKCDYFVGNGTSNVSRTILYLKDWQDSQYILLDKNLLVERNQIDF